MEENLNNMEQNTKQAEFVKNIYTEKAQKYLKIASG